MHGVRDMAVNDNTWFPASLVVIIVVKIRNEESLNRGDSSGNEEDGRGGSCEIFRGNFNNTGRGVQLDSSHSSQHDLLKLII